MIEESAVVVKIENDQVWVKNNPKAACGGCQQQLSCSTNVLAKMLKKKAIPVAVDSTIHLQHGDQVTVAIDEGLLLRASTLLYMLPLVALFFGAAIANGFIQNNVPYYELWLAGGALLGFFLSLWLINKMQCWFLTGNYTRPVVVSKD
jgi:sigma-E factor negative regulatory protein RseC